MNFTNNIERKENKINNTKKINETIEQNKTTQPKSNNSDQQKNEVILVKEKEDFFSDVVMRSNHNNNDSNINNDIYKYNNIDKFNTIKNYINNDINSHMNDNKKTKNTKNFFKKKYSIVPFSKYKKKSNINNTKLKSKNNKYKVLQNKSFINVDVDKYNKNKNYIVKEGEKIYKENNYISKIWDIMSDKVFSEFFDSYLQNYSDVQVAMVFFNVYKCVKEQYRCIFKKDIQKEEMVFMLREIMRNDFMRKYMIQNTNDNNLIQLKSDIITKDIFNMIQNNKNNLLTLS